MSVLDPKSARAKLLAFVVMADQSRGLPSTPMLAARLAGYHIPPRPWRSAASRAAHGRASYALAWLRRSGMVRKGLASFEGGAVVAMVELPANIGIAPQYIVWEATELGRAVLADLGRFKTGNHGGGN